MPTKFKDLSELDQAFQKALKADKKPVASLALLWHEGLQFEPQIPRARTRGHAFLTYYDGHRQLDQVPGQHFEPEKLPHRVCSTLMTKHAASPDVPRLIVFRYDRGPDKVWTGGYVVETLAQYKELVEARKSLDEKFTDALREKFVKGVGRLSLMYGVMSWDEPGPKLLVVPEGQVKGTFSHLEGTLKSLWDELLAFYEHRGITKLYYVNMGLQKPKARLRDGDNLSIRHNP